MSVSGGSADVVIRLRIRRPEPLSGIAVTEEGVELGFEGWMELLQAIAELLGSTGYSGGNPA